jgi:hypothetical protein
MKILIDTDVSDNLGITALELLYLHILHNNLPTELSFEALIELGLLNEDYELTPAGVDIVIPKVGNEMIMFVRTYDEYPHKVGTRVLKSKSIDSADGRHCLSKYKHYLKSNPDLGERMYKGLLIEKHLRKKGGSENFFQDIRTWFNQMTWDKYADLEIETIDIERVERI